MDNEFRWLSELASRLDCVPVPAVRRIGGSIDGRHISGLSWGMGSPQVLALHGGGQNAHTWDATLLALEEPALALDLPGHGHSAWRADQDYSPTANADTVAAFLLAQAIVPRVAVGMSLGGLTALRLGVTRPDLVPRLVLVDITPNSGQRVAALPEHRRGAIALLADEKRYDTFEALVAAVCRALPGRTQSSLTRGLWHNTVRGPDGRWGWRADRRRTDGTWTPTDHRTLWDDVSRLRIPVTLVVARSGVVTAGDVREFRARAPQVEIVQVDTSEHSIQSTRPADVARIVKSQL